MSPLTRRTICLLAISAPVAIAAPDFESQMAQAKEQREKSIAEATVPIDRKYLETLRNLMDKATRAGELDAAVKLKAEIETYDPKGLGARIVGNWTMASKSSRIVFTKNGLFRENWDNKVYEGRWRVISDSVIRVELKDGKRPEYKISDDGNSLKRAEDGFEWLRGE